jgi:hypothetical protein
MAKRARLDVGELERWLAQLEPSDCATVRAALARDADLRDDVEVLLEELPAHLRQAFLDRFHPALADTPRPASAVIEGLRGLIRARSWRTQPREEVHQDE